MTTNLSIQDRQAIHDVLAWYVWCIDTGDREGLVGCFTSDGIVKDISDNLWDASKEGALGFAKRYIDPPGRLGGQHWVQHLALEDAGDGAYRMTSYWYSARPPAEGEPFPIRTLGRYLDTCVKVDGRWLIREKIIDPWNNETVPGSKA
jgi:hypothetical protein